MTDSTSGSGRAAPGATGPGGVRFDSIDTTAAALMIVLTLSWGLGQTAAKAATEGFGPIFQTVFRSGFAAILVFAWCRLRGIALFGRDGTLWPGMLAGFLFGLEFALIYLGLEFTTAARSVLFLHSMPFWVLIGAHFLLGERMTTVKTFGLLLAFAGLWIAFSDEASRPGPNAIWGDLMVLAAGAAWAATTLVIRRSALATAAPQKVLLYQLAASAALFAPLLLVTGPHLRNVTPLLTGALLFQAVVVVAATYQVWFWLISRYPAAGLASFTFLTPVFTVLFSALLLGEPLSARIFVALGMIAVALVVVNRPPRRSLTGRSVAP